MRRALLGATSAFARFVLGVISRRRPRLRRAWRVRAMSPDGRHSFRVARSVILSLPLSLSTYPAAASANVFEIGVDGTARVRSAGAAVQWVAPSAAVADVDEPPDIADDAISQVVAAPVPDAWRATVDRVAASSQISPVLLAAVIRRESAWRSTAVSAKGAIGLAQLMPATARAMDVDPNDPAANLLGCARYLRLMLDRFDGNIERTLAAYKAGPGRVQRSGGIPAIAETRTYVSTIIDRLSATAMRAASTIAPSSLLTQRLIP